MVLVVFIDGTEETFETSRGEYTYDEKSKMFRLWRTGTGTVMFPREFVKYITVVEV